MSFDAHSLERLRQLGRSLPQRLPQPDAAAQAAEPTPARERRHRVETENNPEALFHELMQVSPDGSVPPHLLDRLRQAEATQQRQRQAEQRQALQRQISQSPAPGGSTDLQPRGTHNVLRPNQRRRPPANSEELELYSAFQQLLLEGDEEE
jgi:hypothetical protein